MSMSHWNQVKNMIAEWGRYARTRRELSRFDHRALQDIGMSRCDADHEISKRFWSA